ncbi:ExeM/NucH family extracellular endonuclease [Dyadobacter subterraneus]|uniref:ExeM/NucH family extracellular endonuclease n=1 Tax=Dyadobacter subterraneus TaxID=2773304 RepID=A0ABR9WCL6_9BACT|nr:ExeM/NucH family extracellular endonuclease [Dyadobacter subterraneus]MBE9463229.1 ExeM/NucH family extracellular endonuclease [Dyadobacter subterraneus]
MKRIFTEENAICTRRIKRAVQNAFLIFLFSLIGFKNLQAQAVTQSGFISVLTPQYMSSGTSTRLPVMFRATVTGLTANTLYRYFTGGAISTDFGGTNPGAGNPLMISASGTTYTYSSGASTTSAGNYETFTTDGTGNYTGWFGFVNTGNARFTAGNDIYPVIVIASSTGTILFRNVLDTSIKVLGYGTAQTANTGSFIKETSSATAKNLVAIYDNTIGTGRPLFIAPVEATGATVASVVSGYATAAGSWNAIIPNVLPNGVRRIEQRSVTTGNVVGCATDDDGTWATGSVNTVNPATGTTAITISNTDAPLTSCGPTVTLSVNPATASEASQTVVTITATSTATTTTDQTVTISVTGTGITTSDYSLSSSVITIPAGQTSGTATFTIIDDSDDEGTETAIVTLTNPSTGLTIGLPSSQNITITDNDGAPNANAPVILADNETVIDPEKTTAYLSIPDASPVATPAAFVSGVINDPTDPAKTIGLEFNISDVETAAGLLVATVSSSNTTVVPNANLIISGTGNSRNLKITPAAVGYSDITITVSDGSLSDSYVIKYAASAASGSPATTRFLTQVSDASTAQAVDENYVLVADDENQVLRLYNRTNSGLPVNGFDYTSSLGLTDLSGGLAREVDIESSVKIGNRIFWLGSHGNSSEGKNRPNRSRLFATDLSGTGASATLSYVGRYDGLKTDLLAWDAANANALGLTASAATGKIPEDPALDGFNIEGLTIAPDGTTGYIAFRGPIEPVSSRNSALIIPWTNMTSLVSGNPTTGPATFGTPIQLNLGGRGIREIKKNSTGEYLIIAGPSDGATGIAPKDFRLYTWTGIPADAPVLRSANLTVLNVNGSFESIVDVPANLTSTSQIQLLVDNGDADFYGDATAAKDLSQNNFKKFRSEIVTLGTTPLVATLIHNIQGSGSSAALTGVQTIEGIVTRTFLGTNGLSGFYVQEEDADADSDPATSEGIFVYNVAADPIGLVTPTEGDKVNITGTVTDFVSTTSGVTTSLTELKTLTSFTKIGTAPLPTVTYIKLPVTNVSDLERYEGMLVNLSATTGNLAVTEYFQLGRYGQVVLAADGASNLAGTDARLDQFTQFSAPSVAGYSAYLAEIAKRKIILDDGSGRQNPDPIIFGRGGNPVSATNTLRGGDEVSNVTGILDERLEGYRIQTATGVNFTAANVRPVTPPSVGSSATLKVGSANVLNYFTSLDLNASGTDFRGANTAEELTRQRTKVIKAITGSGADVMGLMELQNNGATPTAALADLVDGLNTEAGGNVYTYVNPGSIATDAITVGIIYKIGKVAPVGSPTTLSTSAAFNLVGRNPLAQTFRQISNDEIFTIVVNHFKSKGSSAGAAGDTDTGDGQGSSNGTRTRQAEDLIAWLATKPTGTTDTDYLILGDLNAYAKEDPITRLATAGYNNLLPVTSYSYVFDGQVGSLDHALATGSLQSQVTGAEKWHINADEPSVLDYNTEFKSTYQVSSLYSADQFRASDHDPILIGLNLTKPLPVNYISFTGQSVDQVVVLKWETANEKDNAGFDILKSTTGNTFEKIGYVSGNATTSAKSSYQFTDADVKTGQIYYYRLEQRDTDGTTDLSRIIGVSVKGLTQAAFVYPNPNNGVFSVTASNAGNTSVRLYNSLGVEIKVNAQKTESQETLFIQPAATLTSGVYFLQLETSDNEKKSLKVVVK